MKRSTLVVVSALLIFCGSNAQAQQPKLDELLKETQQTDSNAKTFRLIWWLPTEYWACAFGNDPNINDFQKREFLEAVDDYIVVVVVDADIHGLGDVTIADKEQVRNKLSLTIGETQRLTPLADADVSVRARTLFAMIKPGFSSTLGQFGEAVEFFYFKGVDAQGKPILDPRANGVFKISYGDSDYRWRLPLGSLLPPKFDPDTNERFPGNYLFSPVTGKPLTPNRP